MKIYFKNFLCKEYLKSALALSFGVMVWSVFKFIAPSQDPTALLSYWKIGYPVSIVLSGFMGIFFPDRPWRWGIIIMFVQLFIEAITTKGDLNLLPPGIVFFALLSIPCMISGHVGAWISGYCKLKA